MSRPHLFDRPTADILLILAAITIFASIILTGAGLVVIALIHPERNLNLPESLLGGVVSTLLGMTSGYLAGRSHRNKPPPSGLDDEQ